MRALALHAGRPGKSSGLLEPRKTQLHVLATERLVLRWLNAEDADFIFELMNDPDWLRYIGDRGIRTLDDARGFIASGPVAMYARLGFGLYAVELREDRTP